MKRISFILLSCSILFNACGGGGGSDVEINKTITKPQIQTPKNTNSTKSNETITPPQKTPTITKDTIAPTITLKGANPQIVEFNSTYKELGAVVSDNEDKNPTLIIDNSKLNLNALGEYKVIYTAIDKAGNKATAVRIVKVVDTTPPVIKLYGSSKVTLQLKEKYQEAGAEAIDNVDGNISSKIKIIGKVDTSKAQEYTLVYSVTDSSGNEANVTRVVTVFDPYSYIPKELNDYMAIRFLNKATFGATKESIKELQELGVEAWIDKQFSIPETKDIYIRNMIELSKLKSSRYTHSVEEYLEDNDIVYFQGSQWERMSSWFQSAINAKDQLRHKTAYNLSQIQIIVESDFEPLFKTRAEVLARYFDILYSNAFKSYKDVLKDITFSSGMGIFLTYRGSRAEYNNSAGVPVYPDENYAREIMQLFTIGLNELNIDGTLEHFKEEKQLQLILKKMLMS